MKAWPETKTSHYCQNILLSFLLFFVAYIGDGPAQTDGGAPKVGSTDNHVGARWPARLRFCARHLEGPPKTARASPYWIEDVGGI